MCNKKINERAGMEMAIRGGGLVGVLGGGGCIISCSEEEEAEGQREE